MTQNRNVLNTIGSSETIPVAFDTLRLATHAAMSRQILDRIHMQPDPTPDEEAMGAYVECLEPQVRDAILRLRMMGYQTLSSGFDHTNAQGQHIQIEPVQLSADVQDRIREAGGQLMARPGDPKDIIRAIHFFAQDPNENAIKEQWNALVDVMPDWGTPAPSQRGSTSNSYFVFNCLSLGLSLEDIQRSRFATDQARKEGLAWHKEMLLSAQPDKSKLGGIAVAANDGGRCRPVA